MKSVEMSDLYLWAILTFLESAEDLGYSGEGDVREWFTSLSTEEMSNKVNTLIDLINEQDENLQDVHQD